MASNPRSLSARSSNAPASGLRQMLPVQTSRIGASRAATSRAIRGCDVHRTAIPPSGPRSRSGSRPPPPGSTSVRGPGQKARARALATSLNARPWASAMVRLLTNSRKGLFGRRPFSRASARTSASRAREPRPYTVSVGYASRPPRCRWAVTAERAPSISASLRNGTAFTAAHAPAPRRFGSHRRSGPLSSSAAPAPPPPRARALTPWLVSGRTRGRGASAPSTRGASALGGRGPARPDCPRFSPPGTSPSRSPPSFASQSGGCWTWPTGSATTTCTTSGCDVNGRSARNSIGTPWIGRNCLGSPGPARTPAPAATITTPMSGRDAAARRPASHPAATLKHREQHREPAVIEARRDPLRRAEPRLRGERLDLDEERAGAFHQRGHGGAGDVGRTAREERRRRVRDRQQPAPGHLEHADLIDRAEPVLHGAQHPVIERVLAFEVKDGVHDVLERLRPGDPAPSRHVPDEQYRGPGLLGEAHQPCRTLPHLAHVSGRALELVGVGGLDRVDEHDAGAERLRVMEDRLEPRLPQHVDAPRVVRQAVGAQAQLVGRLFPRDVEGGDAGLLEPRGALEQQRGFPDPGLAAHQDDGSGDDAPAEDEVEFGQSGAPAGDPHPLDGG